MYPYHSPICRMPRVRKQVAAFAAVRTCRQLVAEMDRQNRCQMDRQNSCQMDRQTSCQMDRRTCRQIDRPNCRQMDHRNCCQIDRPDQKILQEWEMRRVCADNDACVHFTSEDGFCLSQIEICACVDFKSASLSSWTVKSSLNSLATSTLRARVIPPENLLTPRIILPSFFRVTENNQSQLN